MLDSGLFLHYTPKYATLTRLFSSKSWHVAVPEHVAHDGLEIGHQDAREVTVGTEQRVVAEVPDEEQTQLRVGI